MNTIAPLRQALVRTLRSEPALKAALVGDVHEGIAPPGTAYPFLTYQVHYAAYNYLWDSVIEDVGFDVFVWAENSVDAHNIDQLVFTILHDAELPVSGQTTLICRRMNSISMAESNEEGRKIYQVGGTYQVWTDQPLPAKRRHSVAGDAVIA